MLKTHFNTCTKKAKNNFSWRQLCCFETMPITEVSHASMMKIGKIMIKKEIINCHVEKEDKHTTFEPNYALVCNIMLTLILKVDCVSTFRHAGCVLLKLLSFKHISINYSTVLSMLGTK